MTNPLVSFVVLNWNGLTDTLVCLKSLREQTYKAYEIIVVDNGSTPEQKASLRQIDDITLIDLPHNTGFTGGQLEAYKIARGDFIALINNDSVISSDWTEKALRLIENDKVAAVGGRAYQWDQENKERPYSETNHYYSYQVVDPLTGHCSTLQSGESEVCVNSISGAAVLIKRTAIESVGYFDNRYFAYYEETDLFARMKRAGYQIIYSPELKVLHKIAASTRSNPRFYLYQMHRNRFIFAVKNYDRQHMWGFMRYYFLKEWLGAIKHVIGSRSKANIEQRMLVKAGVWNLIHLGSTLLARSSVMKLGATYSSLLVNDAPEDLTIIIPCYNYSEYIKEAIVSAAGQTRPPSAITIIDDGSTDKSLKIINSTVKKLKAKHPNIVFKVCTQKNSGIVRTKNRGIEEAASVWIVFLDADDKLDKNYLLECFTAQIKRNADVVYTDMKMFGALDYIQKVLPYNRYRLRSVNYIHNSALFKTNLLRAAGGYSEEMSIGYEDWELNLKLSKLTSRFTYLPKPLLYYRRHDGSSRDNNAQQKLVLVVKMLEKMHPELYNMRFYWWLESNRAWEALKELAKYPFLILRHTYYHTLMGLDRRAKHNKRLKSIMRKLRGLKHRGAHKSER